MLAASAGATAFRLLEVPYGGEIGAVAGAALAFLAISYWYYGRE